MTPTQESWAWLAGAAAFMAVLFVTPALVTVAPDDQSADGLSYLAEELGCNQGPGNRTFTRSYRPVDGPLGRWTAVDRLICRDVEKASAQAQELAENNAFLSAQYETLNRDLDQATQARRAATDLKEAALLDAEKAQEAERDALKRNANLTAFNEIQRQTIVDRDLTIQQQASSLQAETAQNAKLREKLTEVTESWSLSEQALIAERAALASATQDMQALILQEAELNREIAQLQARRDDLRAQLEGARSELETASLAFSELEQAKGNVDIAFEEGQGQIAALTGERDGLSNRLLETARQIQGLEGELDLALQQILDRDQRLEGKDVELGEIRNRFLAKQDELADALAALGITETELFARIAAQDELESRADTAEREAALLKEELNIYLAQLGLFQGLISTVAQWDRATVDLAASQVFAREGAALTVEANLFDPGSPDFREDAGNTLERLVQVLLILQTQLPGELDWAFLVRGHADADSISTDRFPSNWELSAARAASVVRYFESQGVDPHRLQVSGQSNAISPREGGPARRITIDFQPRINDLVIQNGL